MLGGKEAPTNFREELRWYRNADQTRTVGLKGSSRPCYMPESCWKTRIKSAKGEGEPACFWGKLQIAVLAAA